MSNRVKATVWFSICGLFAGFYWWMIWKSSPKLAIELIAYNRAHPMSWLDFGLGCVMTFFTMMVIMIWISLHEATRFERDLDKKGDGGPEGSGDGGGQKKIVRLPMSRKVVEIGDWRKAPTDGHVHRGMLPV